MTAGEAEVAVAAVYKPVAAEREAEAAGLRAAVPPPTDLLELPGELSAEEPILEDAGQHLGEGSEVLGGGVLLSA